MAPQQDPRDRPWFMAGGERRPVAARRAKSGRRMAHLWPAEDPSSDRVADQLMFIPPAGKYSDETGKDKIKFHFISCRRYLSRHIFLFLN